MADPRQINQLPVATEAEASDLLLIRQGLFDKQIEVGVLMNSGETGALLAANNLSDVANAATARANLGIDTSGFLSAANNLSDIANAATARTNLGVPEATATPSLTTTNDFAFNQLLRMQIRNYSETVVAGGNITGTKAFSCADGNIHTATVTGAVTVSFTNVPSAGQAGSIMLILTNGGSAAVTWPAAVKWPSGSAPALTSSGVDLLIFTTVDGGTTWYSAMGATNLS